jgi:fructose-1,6-bisphosphatase/inositol monophosphatase family enzyme
MTPLLKQLEQTAMEGFGCHDFEHKPDGSLVTRYDKAVEERFRESIAKITPKAGVWGEEFGLGEEGPDGLWLIDPIDGTSNFIFGLPEWGVTISLYQEGRLVLGVIALPVLGETLWAEDGKGATRNGAPMPTLRAGGIERHELAVHGHTRTHSELAWPGKIRKFGSFVSDFYAFAIGGVRAMTSANAQLYDAGAGIVIAREVGADLIHFDGRQFDESDWIRPERMEGMAFVPPEWNLAPKSK